MLETPGERVELLKAGITGETIEKLYVMYNNFKIVRTPLRIELVEIDINNNSTSCREASAGYAVV
ncbi:MAG: hypothetical protein ABOK23_02715 [Candidatus Methanoperedens sp.]|nr:hypothetical protein [Candidatus Methanoperedens sp.]MCZ7394756.1 hypothetical protein [Candidatus Methanoperedens sp.]